jgi:DNA-binding CsgD family transcriptional regulator
MTTQSVAVVRPATPDEARGRLTPDQLIIVDALADGATQQQIGHRLGLGKRAVNGRLDRARAACGTTRTTLLVGMCTTPGEPVEWGLGAWATRLVGCVLAEQTRPEMASVMGWSTNRLDINFRLVMERLDATTRAHAVAIAVRTGLIGWPA